MQYGLIGERLGHSYSRDIHGKIADYVYELKELTPEELGPFLTAREFRAINVTIPYKEAVIPYLDDIDPAAKAIGAVNTVVNREGRLYGYNTDHAGMKAQLAHMGVSLRGKKVLVLGTGGTSKTARAVAESLGADRVIPVSRSGKDGAVTYEEAVSLHRDADFIFNTTPVGMYPKTDGTPIDLSAFDRLSGLLDAIYHPLRTELVQEGAKRGIPSEGGLYMLAAQAVFASALFRGVDLSPALAEEVYRQVKGEKENLVLIGMPSAGKTTVGKLLAEKTGRPFYDTDEVLARELGQPVAAYLSANGEAAFREKESDVIRRLSGETGCILATGGGAVLRDKNVTELKKNGVILFLDRDIRNLTPTPDRPLSSDPDKLCRLYETRYPLYQRVADKRVEANGTVEEVVQAVREALETL